jgi:hypothetical protein
MVTEENKKAYEYFTAHPKEIDNKTKDTMLFIIRLRNQDEAPVEVFNHLVETYTKEELALIATIHIGNELKEALQTNEVLRETANMIRHLDKISKPDENSEN